MHRFQYYTTSGTFLYKIVLHAILISDLRIDQKTKLAKKEQHNILSKIKFAYPPISSLQQKNDINFKFYYTEKNSKYSYVINLLLGLDINRNKIHTNKSPQRPNMMRFDSN